MMENYPQGFNELQPGTALSGGKYVIESKIGEGGFGITYKAVQTGLYRPVCIKEYFLAGRCVRNTQARTVHLQGISEEKFERFRQAFVKEAQTVASLHHPNIVEVIDIFDENNTSYMVMTFIEGCSLQRIVNTNGPLSYPDAVNYMAQISNAVDYIHKHNILHRDIKPDNIMVTPDYKAILIDFGSAREFEQDKTQMHTSMLTHGYAPPEQYTSNSRKGSYTDIYALGATLYFILTGKVPLEAAARLTEPLVEPKVLNPSIPPEANQTVMKAMNLKKENRYQQVQDFMDDLKNVRQKVPEIQGDTIQQPKAKTKTNRWLLWIILSAVVVLGCVILGILVHRHTDKDIQQDYAYSIYSKALDDFDKHLECMNDPQQLTIPRHVMGALEELVRIEEYESRDLFKQSGMEPHYQEKLEQYEQKIREENETIQMRLSLECSGKKNSAECQQLEKRLLNNVRTLTQLEQTGSACEVNLEPSN